MKLKDIVARLQNPKKTAAGYTAKCPAHDDQHNSLSIGQRGTKIVVKCFAGCKAEDIVAAIGLRMADLFDDDWRGAGHGEVVAVYDYRAADGTLLYQVVRYHPKTFRQRRPGKDNKWIWNLDGVPRVLYRLPELMAADPHAWVLIPEGEKDVDNLIRLGLVATTNPGGANAWRPEYAQYLRDRRVAILADNDEAGHKHAREIARTLTGVAKEVRVIDLPVGEHGDVSDWLAAGGTPERLIELIETPAGTVDDTSDAELDYGHAIILEELLHERLHYIEGRGKWIIYDGRVWQTAEESRVANMCTDALRQYYSRKLSGAVRREEVMRLTRYLKETCIAARIRGALYFLRGRDRIAIRQGDLDAKPWLLNVANGTIDLRKMQIRPHRAEDMITKIANAEYNPTARGAIWQEHLDRCLPDAHIRRQVQRDLGRSLVGATLEEVLPIWYGTGANGKSTTIKAIMHTLGDYASKAAPNLLVYQRNEPHPTGVADLFGRRLVFSVEIDEGKRLAEAIVKELTGGDRKKARYMREDFFEFEQTFSITLVVNHRPTVMGTDNAIWRRIRLIPWEATIPPEERRPQDEVVADLVGEASAILNWLLDGLRDWQSDHGWVAPEVTAATDEYRREQDVIGDFLADKCEFGQRYIIAVAELYNAYTMWCANAGEEAVTRNRFGRLLRQRGVQRTRDSHGNTWRWLGVKLKED